MNPASPAIPAVSLIALSSGKPGAPRDFIARAPELPHGELEVIVVINGGREEDLIAAQKAAASRPDAVKVFSQAQSGGNQAANSAAAQARGRVLFFTGDDCFVAVQVLREVRDRFAQDPTLAALCGRVAAEGGDKLPARVHKVEREYLYDTGGFAPDPLSLAVSKEAFLSLGALDQAWNSPAPELGLMVSALEARERRVVYTPEVVVRQDPLAGWREYFAAQLNLAKNWHMDRFRRGRLGFVLLPAPLRMPLQVLAALAALGLLGAFNTLGLDRSLTLAAICLLLLYPLNRDFLNAVAQADPGITPKAFLAALARPFCWAAGIGASFLNIIGGG